MYIVNQVHIASSMYLTIIVFYLPIVMLPNSLRMIISGIVVSTLAFVPLRRSLASAHFKSAYRNV
jgi:hypothetical protein